MPQRECGRIFQSGRDISDQEISEIRETVGLFPELSRSELVATICEHLGWVTASGSYKLDACMKLLEKLESEGFLRLPDSRDKGFHHCGIYPSTRPGRSELSGCFVLF